MGSNPMSNVPVEDFELEDAKKYGPFGSFDGYDPEVDLAKVQKYVAWKKSRIMPWIGEGRWWSQPQLNRIEKIRAGLMLRQYQRARCFWCEEGWYKESWFHG